jgi:hypothetical protein
MPRGPKRIPPALKHGAYSEVTLLPGEDPDEFAELHRGLIAEFAPNGRMEEETVATIARLTWRRQNLARFQIGQLSNYMIEAIREGTKKLDEGGLSNVVSDLNKMVEARERVEKAQGNRKTEALVEFGEIAKQATLSPLMKQLDIEERLDSMIDRLIKRLLFVRGLKSITSSAATAAPATAQKGSRRIRAV